MTTVATLEIPVDFVFDQSSKMASDSKGNIILASRMSSRMIAVFARNGKLLRQFGLKGAGPGELRDVTDIAVDFGDSLHVFDQALRRISIYAADGKFVRVVPLSTPSFDNLFLRSGSFIGFVSLSRSDSATSPLRLFRPDGTIDHALVEAPADKVRLPDGLSEMRVFARANDSDTWVGRADRISIEKRSGTDGRLVSAFEIKDHWIATMNAAGTAVSPARILGLRQDGGGLLWVSGLLKDKRAKPVVASTSRVEPKSAPVNPSLSDLTTEWDSFLEVIDPRTKKTVSTKTVDDVYIMIRGSDLWFRVREDASGEEVVELVQPKLTSAKR